MIEVTALQAFEDNYIWVIHDDRNAVVMDPGDARPVQAWLAQSGRQLTAILLTHHHSDHIGGVPQLTADYRVPVIGHAQDAHRLPALSHAVLEGDTVNLPGLDVQLSVIATPGHTLGHVCYFGAGLLFCGDTLFSGGCGRMFEGTALQFQGSLARLALLPPETKVFAAHEYTLGNINFAAMLTPADEAIQQALHTTRSQRAEGKSTLPSTIGWERRHNPFLRCETAEIALASGRVGAEPAAVFAAIRRAKDGFRST